MHQGSNISSYICCNSLLLGNALSALGRKEDALLVWEQGHANAVLESTDLKELLELEELLVTAKQNGVTLSEDRAADSSHSSTTPASDAKAVVCENHVVDSSCSSTLTTDTESESQSKDIESETHSKCTESETQSKCTESETQRKAEDADVMYGQPSDAIETCNRSNGIIKTNRNVFDTKSIILDFRLSRGIAQVKSFMLLLKCVL